MQKAILFLIINFNFLLSAESINPFYKSVLIPGWGESSLGYKDKSKFFIITETVIGLSCISLHKIAEMKENEYILFAYENANAKKIRNHEYWVDIGNYIDIDTHNDEHLRWRYFDELYDVLFVKSSKKLGLFLWKFCDGTIIDGFGPDGISAFIKKCSIKATKFQSGFIYQYAFVMLLGFSALLTFLIVK